VIVGVLKVIWPNLRFSYHH